MTHICIIGVGGVGAAHAISAAKYLDSVGGGEISLVARRENAFANFTGDLWANRWGPINDEYSPKNIKAHYYWQGEIPDADLYIVSTPNDSHIDFIKALKGKLAIIEKPLVEYGQTVAEDDLWDTLHYGVDWVYHPDLIEVAKNKTDDNRIMFCQGFPPPQAQTLPYNRYHVHDLGSHALTIAQFVGAPLTDDFKFNNYDMLTSVETGNLRMKFGYDILVPEILLYVNGKKINWIPFLENDLFYRQIEYVLANPSKPVISAKQLVDSVNHLSKIRG
jgi:hypothetical protein